MASANDPFERGFRITQYKIAKTTFWRPIGAPGIFGFDDVYGDTIDAIQEVRDLGYLGSQQSLHLEMPSGTHGTSDRIPWYHLEPINRTTWRPRTVSTYKTAAEKAQEHWELVERLRVKARLAESDVLWTAAEAERLIAKRAMIAAEKRRARRAKKQKVEREQRALQVEQLARDQRERDAQQELAQAKQRRADAEQRATAARAELAKAQANPPKPAPAIVPATTIPKSTVDYDRDFDIPCDLLFPQWQDARVHLARFLAVGEPWTWEAFLMADGRTFIALSNKHFIFDQSQRAFNCGMVVPPGSTWGMFLKRYRLGLGTYLNFKRPRYPERRAEYENQPYTITERQAWQMECVAAVRLRESQLVAQGWPSARVSLARAFGIRYDGR